MSKIKQLSIILTISIILVGVVVLLYLLDPAFVPDAYRVASMVIVVSWAFFIVPSIIFGVQLAKKYFEGKSPEHAFRDGVRFGVIVGFGGMIVLSLLVSPNNGNIVVYKYRQRNRLIEKE